MAGTHAERRCDRIEATSSHAVGAVLVFLDLLESNSHPRGEFGLAHAAQRALSPHLRSDMCVDVLDAAASIPRCHGCSGGMRGPAETLHAAAGGSIGHERSL